MKRRRLLGTGDGNYGGAFEVPTTNSINTIPPTESTLLIETGNSSRQKGQQSSCGQTVSSLLSAGLNAADSIQYNEVFWMNDQYTFTPRNCMIGLYVLCWTDPSATNLPPQYEDTSGKYCAQIIPFTLPWLKMSFGESDQLEDPETFGTSNEPRSALRRLQDQLAYSLNLMWNYNYSKAHAVDGDYDMYDDVDCNKWTVNRKCCDCFNDTQHDDAGPDFRFFPMYQNETSNKAPPLRWFIGPNGSLGIKRNGAFNDGGDFSAYRFAFNFVTIRETFLNKQNFYRRKVRREYPHVQASPSLFPSIIPAMFGDSSGWVGYGHDVYGIGNFKPGPGVNGGAFHDDYVGSDGNTTLSTSLFETTCYNYENLAYNGTGTFPSFTDYAQFQTFVKTYKLKEDVVIGEDICSMAYTRFYYVSSDTLTKQIRIKNISNNPNLAKQGVIAFMPPPSTPTTGDNLYQKTNSLQSFVGPNAPNINPVLDANKADPKTILDLSICDERGNCINNLSYGPQQAPLGFDNFKLFEMARRDHFPPHSFYGHTTIPPLIGAWNPDPTTYPDDDCLLGYNRLSQMPFLNPYPFEPQEAARRQVAIGDPSFNVTCHTASWLLHFLRIIGKI